MASFLRISDIPPDELHLLPIVGLRQQIRADHTRPSPPADRTGRRERDGLRPGQPFPADFPAAQAWAATGERFVTDWQLHGEPSLSSRFPFDREDRDNDENGNDEDFGEEEFDDPDGEDVTQEEDVFQAGEEHQAGDDFDALYVDIGGEG